MNIIVPLLAGVLFASTVIYLADRTYSLIRRHTGGHGELDFCTIRELKDALSLIEDDTLPVVVEDGWKKYFVRGVGISTDKKLMPHSVILQSTKKLNDLPKNAEFKAVE